MVMSLIESLTKIKNAVYGREVREAIHDGVFRANQIADGADTKADNTQLRQDAVEDFNAQVIQEMTDKDVISAPEIIQARGGESTLEDRLDKELQDVLDRGINVRNFKELIPGYSVLTNLDNADWTDAINAAVAFGGDRAQIFFPSDGRYQISGSINVPYNYVTFLSNGVAGNQARIVCKTPNVDMIKATGYVFKLKDIILEGDGTTQTTDYEPTIRGLVIDRSTDVSDNRMSSLDAEITGSTFYALKECIRFKGINVKVLDNLFSSSQYGIVADNYAGVKIRGLRVEGNRFHVMGEGLYTDNSQESWCVKILSNNAHGNTITNNFVDYASKGFYKGPIDETKINENHIYRARGTAIYITSVPGDSSLKKGWSIQNNTISSDANLSLELSHMQYGILFEGQASSGLITGNSIFGSRFEAIKISSGFSLNVSDNIIVSPNSFSSVYGIEIDKYAGISILDGNSNNISNNTIRTTGAPIKAGIENSSNNSQIINNIVIGAEDDVINTSATTVVLDAFNLMQSGSGSNGSYTKLGDGTMICRTTKKNISVPAGTTVDVQWVYPIPFTSDPDVVGIVELSSNNVAEYSNLMLSQRFQSSSAFKVQNTSSSGSVELNVSMVAIGRWK